jgi:hypothetical protein
MLPGEQEIKARLITRYNAFKYTKEDVLNYAKWYAEQVVKHCAEVAEISYIGDPDYDYDFATVSRKSILDVIKEL